MKIKDIIATAKERDVIDSVKGIIFAVETPNRPTEKQQKAGIHVQRITLQDMQGQPLEIQLMKESLHIKPDTRGQIFYARSVQGDRGLSGLTASVYQGKTSLCVWGDAAWELQDAPPEAVNAVQTRAAPKASGSFAFAAPSRALAVETYFKLMDEVCGELEKRFPKINPSISEIKEIATVLFIEGQKSGWLYQNEVVATSNQTQPAEPEAESPPWNGETENEDPGLPKGPGPVDKEDLCRMIVEDAVNGTLAENISEAEDSMKSFELTWDEVYDELQTKAEAVYEVMDINGAYDTIKTMLARRGKATSNDVSRMIALDWVTFMAECGNAAKLNGQEIPQ